MRMNYPDLRVNLVNGNLQAHLEGVPRDSLWCVRARSDGLIEFQIPGSSAVPAPISIGMEFAEAILRVCRQAILMQSDEVQP